jgi:superfamily II DNA or RNA helicase
MNPWSVWSSKDLQKVIEEQNPGLLDRLEVVLPGILGDDFYPDDLYDKQKLKNVIEAFLPSDAFAQKEFRFEYLNRLQPEYLNEASSFLGLAKMDDFGTSRDAIVAEEWKIPFATKFVEFFELPNHFLPEETNKKENSIDIFPPTEDRPLEIKSNFKQLIDYQSGIYYKALEKMNAAPRTRFIIQMPTGSGKTRTAMELVCNALNGADDISVFWLAHTQELCEQGIQCFLQTWPHLAKKKVRAHRYWGNHPQPIPLANSNDFVVGGFGKICSALKKDANSLVQFKNRCSLIVVDEAHKTEAPTYKKAVQALLGQETAVIGLTATPGRTYVEESMALSDFYFNQLIELPDPRGNGVIEMLRDRKVLSKAEYRPIITNIDIPLSDTDRKYLEEHYELPPKIISKLAHNDVRNIEIIQTLRKELNNGKRVLVFGCSVNHSRYLNSVLLYLKAIGEKVFPGHIDGNTNLSKREALIKKFRNGELNVLCNYGVLSTGFDAPKTDAVMITRPTTSPVLYSQMIGRGLRGPIIGGTEFCRIIDVRDNIGEFGDADSVYSIFEDYWVN